ncbi:MAG TPA: phosphomannomutase/phosphoglucomutase, partial [Nocardioides sp.]
MPDATTLDQANLQAIFKAYDVRGTVGDQIDELLARRIGGAFVAVTGAGSVVVGHDMRPSSPGLAQAFAQGATQAGAA